MGEAGAARAVAEPRAAAQGASRPLAAGDLAWLGLIPCAAIVAFAIVALGPPVGSLLFPPSGLRFWPQIGLRPEPTEHARYLLALTAPLLLTGFIVAGRQHPTGWQPRTVRAVVLTAQVLALGFLALCVAQQYRYVFSFARSYPVVYFKPPTLLAAAVFAAATSLGLLSGRSVDRIRALSRERRGLRLAGAGVAAVAVAVWVMPALNTESTIGEAHRAVVEHFPYWLDEAFAPLDGRFPLVGYTAQYGSLWPYLVAGAMALLGASIGVFTAAMATINAAAMLAMFGVLRRVTRNTVGAVVLFLPFLATSFFMMEGPLSARYATVNLFSTFPLRYAGPFLLLWLLARHLDGTSPRAPRWLFLAAALTVLNNVDFGVPALGATVAALLWTRRRTSLGRLALEAGAGLAAALAIVSALTLVIAGSLPDIVGLFRFSDVFAVAGFGMLPIHPTIGMSTIIFLTYVAAIAVATARAMEGSADRLMTGLLAWSGVFGLGVGSYYVGRSDPEVLTNMFSAWALSLTLLLALSARRLLARPRRPSLADVVVLFAFGILACSLAQTPNPLSEVRRIGHKAPEIYRQAPGEPFIARNTHPGERVAILIQLGHRTAYDLKLDDVTPYASMGSMPTVEQLDETLTDLRSAGGAKVFYDVDALKWPGVAEYVVAHGYRPTVEDGGGIVEFVRSG